MDELLLPFLAFAGWCLGIAGYVKARRALAEVAALRAQIAGEPPPVAAPAQSFWTAPSLQAASRAPKPAPPARPRLDIETLLTQRLGVWLGAAALLLAGVFLVRTAAEQGWLGPEVRCALAALLGAALIGAAEWLRRRPNPPNPAPAALAAGGTAVLFSAAYATGALYELVPPLAGFALMAAAGLASLALSLLHGPLVAIIGLVGAFATPLLVQTGPPDLPGLFGYLLLVTAAALMGGTLAATSHATKLTMRASANTSPEPFSNIALSLLGDSAVPLMLWLSWVHPVIALVALTALVPIGVVHRHDHLLEWQPRLLAREPAAQRPGGIGLVADDELHARPARGAGGAGQSRHRQLSVSRRRRAV